MARPGILQALRIRDFAVLWTGLSVSLLGDGIYLVAIAWQVYELSNVPTALSLVGVAWTLPQVLFLLVGGVLADRFVRRRILIAADAVRALAVAAIGALSVAGVLELWHVIALVAVYGSAEGFFYPAFGRSFPTSSPMSFCPRRTPSTSSCGRSRFGSPAPPSASRQSRPSAREPPSSWTAPRSPSPRSRLHSSALPRVGAGRPFPGLSSPR